MNFMKIDIGTVKGFQDYLPPESLKRKKIVGIVEKYYRLYGFMPIETPIVEFDELMKPDVLSEEEDEAIADRFRLQDKGGRNLGLRYEFTFQLARILKENPNIKLPFRRYQIGPVFRDEPIRTGRTRQFVQCDADIIGDATVNADAECLALVSDILSELKINNFEIQINNRKLLNSIIESVEIKDVKNVMRELDKTEKLGVDLVKANLRKYTSANQIITLFKLMEKDITFFKDNAFDGAEELEELIKKCKLYGIKIRFNPSLIRGFAYYTGNIFEVTLPEKKTSLAGGGRYDKTVGKFVNREIPAIGISFSLEALIGLCSESIDKIKLEPVPEIIIISFNKYAEAVKLARKLRKNETSCIINEGQPSKALDFANSMNIPFVIFVGDAEIEQEKYKLKDMKSGEEKLLTEKQLFAKFSK